MSLLLNPRDIDFILYEVLDTLALTRMARYAEHDREVFDAVITAAHKLALDKFAPFAAKLDANEPRFDGQRVHLIPELREALGAYIDGGFMGISAEYRHGGMQLPWVVAQAACAFIAAADVSANAYAFLTHAAINQQRKRCQV